MSPNRLNRPVTDYLKFTGSTRALSIVDLRSRVEGYLKEIHFEDGATVKKGQLLLTIDPAPFRAKVRIAQAELQRSKADLALAEQELGRLTTLLRRNAVTMQELEIEKAKRDSAAAVVAGAEASLADAELQLSYTEIFAPLSGRIGRHLVDIGNLVQVEQTLLGTIESYDPIYVFFTLSEGDLLDLRRERIASGRSIVDGEDQQLEMRLGGEDGFPHQGSLDFTELGVDPDTGTMQLRGIFPNPDRQILPGLFAEVRTAIGSARPQLLVPERALGTDQQGDYVLVVDDENKVEYRSVTLGREFGEMRVITKGLEGNEWIVINGVQRPVPARPSIRCKARSALTTRHSRSGCRSRRGTSRIRKLTPRPSTSNYPRPLTLPPIRPLLLPPSDADPTNSREPYRPCSRSSSSSGRSSPTSSRS